MGIINMSEEESSTYESTEESSEWITETDEDGNPIYEEVDPNADDGEERTRGLGDLLAAVGISKPGEKPQPLLDENGNPITPVYQDGQYQVPTLTDKDGNVVHEGEKKEGMSTGTKVAIAGAGLAGLAVAGATAVAAGTAATAVGVHYYRKKKNKEDKKDKKDKKDKGDKDKKDKKDKKVKKDKK